MLQFQKQRLSNGLEVIAEINSAAYSASFGFFVNTGSRNEKPEIAGVSHFLEHMIFKGSALRSAEEVNRQFDEMGADANAFTTEEQTVFFASLLPELLNDALDLFADLLRPALRTEDFETEKQVILEEIRMYEDLPPFGADDKSRELFFAGHPLANNILGTAESVVNLSAEQMRNYFNKQYRPENIVLVGSGQIQFDEFVQKAEEVCGHWTSQGQEVKNNSGLRRVRGQRGFYRFFKESAAQQYILLLTESPAACDTDRYAAGILAGMLGDETGSRLYWELVDSGLADSAEIGIGEFLDNGLFVTELSGEPETADEILERTMKIFSDVERNGFSQEELERSKNKVCSRIVLANERPVGRLFTVGSDWTLQKQYRTIQQEIEEIRRITIDKINDVLKKYPLLNPLFVTIGPLKNFVQKYC